MDEDPKQNDGNRQRLSPFMSEEDKDPEQARQRETILVIQRGSATPAAFLPETPRSFPPPSYNHGVEEDGRPLPPLPGGSFEVVVAPRTRIKQEEESNEEMDYRTEILSLREQVAKLQQLTRDETRV